MIRIAAGAAVLLLAAIGHFYDRHLAYGEGQRAERLAWMEQRAKDIARLEVERKATQAKIDQIETEYWAARTDHELALAGIEKALADETQTDDACRTVLSRRMRDSLNAIGRQK